MPGTDAERNRLLAESAARQLIDAAAAQKEPIQPYVQTNLLQSLIRAGNFDVAQQQKDTIAGLVDDNLEPPEFSNRLEASAYTLTRYDDEKKADLAVSLAVQIRQAAQLKAEEQAATDMEDTRGLTMS